MRPSYVPQPGKWRAAFDAEALANGVALHWVSYSSSLATGWTVLLLVTVLCHFGPYFEVILRVRGKMYVSGV